MTSEPIERRLLAADFPPATEAAWRASAEKGLKGATIDSLTAAVEGVTIEPLYTATTSRATLAKTSPAHLRRAADRPWDVRAPISGPGREAAHDQILDALGGGAASVLIDTETLDISDAPAMAALLDGVLTDIAPIALDAGKRGAVMADALSEAVKASPAARLAFHLDPLSATALSDPTFPENDGATLKITAEVAARLMVIHPKASLFLASGVVVHEAGGEPAWELAFAIAAAVGYARALGETGVGAADAFSRIVLALAVDNKPLIAIAKLRAARTMWARVSEACGGPTPAVIEARSSRRMLTIADPWSNLIRVTQAGFAGAVGGADAIVLYPHDRAGDAPDPLSARLARNAALILMEEAHLGAVRDPVAGAWAFEALTDQLARAAWAHFQAIEKAGGAQEALRSGLIADAVAASARTLSASIAHKKTRIVGVTDFRADPAASTGETSTPATFAPIRLETLAR